MLLDPTPAMATADQIMAKLGDMRRRLDQQEAELSGLRQRGGGQSNTGLGDHDWNCKFKSHMGNISAPLMKGMSTIEHRQDVLETSGYTEEQSQMATIEHRQDALETSGYTEEQPQMAAGLYHQSTMYTEDEDSQYNNSHAEYDT